MRKTYRKPLTDVVAQTIRIADGDHTMGAGELSEYITATILQSDWLRSVLEDAWEDGRNAGVSRAMRYMSDEPSLDPYGAVNPYKIRLSTRKK
jgi:hypothetical protein